MASSNSSKSNVPAAAPAPTILQPGSGTVLTVGAGMEFATLKDACKAAVAGDTIAVKAGTYVNDFASVTSAVHIVAVGGLVNEVATVPPPNDKGLLTVDANLSIQGFAFTGGSDGNWDGNVAGIRLENGNLNVSYCYFHDMQEGLLADPDSTASVTIDHSEFAHNGTGDGYSHNLYVGAVASLSITNSYFHDAVVGHEIKSRAAVTTIANNVIANGPNGTASYDIDLPNGGVGKITGNILEKGPNASNRPVIHYGGETQYAWANNSLTISGNTILDDLGAAANVVLNQSAVNGLTVNANVTGNSLYGFDPAAMVSGPGTLTNNTILSVEPTITAPVTWVSMPVVGLASGPALVDLNTGNHTVSGGVSRLTVNDSYGSNTVNGGSGGLNLVAVAGWDSVSTQVGAVDLLTLSGRNTVVVSKGTDHISAIGLYEEVDATGAATITSSGFSTYNLNGVNEQLNSSASCVLNVGAAGNVRVSDAAGDIRLSVAQGGHLVVADQAAATGGAPGATATIVGAVGGTIGNSGLLALSTSGSGAYVQAGTGAVSVTGGDGADTLTAGPGQDVFVLGGGADQVVFGTGAASVTGGAGVDTYHFHAGSKGHDTIADFKQGVDVLKFEGFTGSAIAGGTITSGNTVLTLTDGTIVTFAGVVLPGYGAASAGGGTASPGPGPAPTLAGGSGGTVLTTPGNLVTGGASLLNLIDQAGSNTIAGGAGGLWAAAGYADFLSTAANSANHITLSHGDTLAGAGSDQVTVNSPGNLIREAGIAAVNLLGGGNSVQGGAGALSVSDAVGGDTVVGGSGGLAASLAGWYDLVTTAAPAADTVSLSGYSTLLSQGQDHIAIQGLYNAVTQTGAATITSASGFGSYDLEGNASLVVAGGGTVLVGQHASASIASASQGDLAIAKLAGGQVSISDALPGQAASVDIAGGAATITASTGTYAGLAATVGGATTVLAGGGPLTLTSVAAAGSAADSINGGAAALVVNAGGQGVFLAAGSGNVTLNGGNGNDVFTGGSGQALLKLGNGADTVTIGNGSITVQGGAADHFGVPGAATGMLTIMNWTAQDSLITPGQPVPAIGSETVSGGSLYLTMSSGAHIELVGVAHMI